jgi:hypothetical protein
MYESLQPQMERCDAVEIMPEAFERPPRLFLLFRRLWYQADVNWTEAQAFNA